MKQIIISFLFIVFFNGVDSQNIQVINAVTGEPVEGVLVISGKTYTAQTDEKGNVDFDGIHLHEPVLFQHSSFLDFSSTKEKILSGGKVVLLVEDPVRIDEVVVSVNRWKQSKTEVPLKIKTLTGEDILRYNSQTVADMLGTEGGIFIQKSQMGGGSPMIRGFAANRVLIVVDGIRMNNAIFRSGNLHNLISLDANALENTEVIFGPGSVIYGSDALGGVMSFNTLTPKLTTTDKAVQSGKVLTRFSSANFEKTVHGSLNFGSKKWAALVSSSFSGFDDLRMGAKGPEKYLREEYVSPRKFTGMDRILQNEDNRQQKFSGYNQFNVLSKLRIRPGNKADIVLSAHHAQTSDIPRYDRLIFRNGNKLGYGEWYYGPQKWTLFSGQVKYDHKHVLFDKVNLLAGVQLFNESRHDRKLNSEILRHRDEKLSVFSLNLDFGKTINDKNEIFYGAEAFFNEVGSSATAESIVANETEKIASRYPDGSEYKCYAAYFSFKHIMNKQLILQAGSRITQTFLNGDFDPEFYQFSFSGFDIKNAAFNGNFGLVWHPASEWQVNVNVSTGFRSPNIDDVAKVFDSEPGNVIVPNPGLKPEYARNIELGIIRRYAGKARIEMTGFFTHLKNAMVRRDFSINGKDSIVYDGVLSEVEALVNAESAGIYGCSIYLEYLFTSSLRSRNDFTITFGNDSEGYPVRHVPPAYGSSHLIFEKQKWFFDLYAEYSGSFDYEELAPSEQDKPHLYAADKDGNPWSPSWWTLNIKSECQMNDMFSISGGIENMLDKRYRTYSSGIVAPGMNFILSAKLQF